MSQSSRKLALAYGATGRVLVVVRGGQWVLN
jgi:hypothetical protein